MLNSEMNKENDKLFHNAISTIALILIIRSMERFENDIGDVTLKLSTKFFFNIFQAS